MNISDIKKLANIMKENDLTCIEFETEAGKVKLCKEVTTVVRETSVAPVGINLNSQTENTAVQTFDDDADYIVSPTVGVFYQSPAPDSDPYVTVGSSVKAGDVICIVEAMKMMNEIQADRDGVIAEILVNDGDLVEFEQPMFKLK